MHLVGFFHVAINLHHVGGGGSVAGAGGARHGSVDLAREVAGAQRVAAAGSGAQRPGQRPVLLARVGADLVGGADVEDQRYCDPALVVFVSTDPVMVDLKNARNFCRYCYGGDSPYRFIDSDGHAESPAWMRSFIPGQIAWDTPVTSAERGEYGMAAAQGVVAVAGGTMSIMTSRRAQGVAATGRAALIVRTESRFAADSTEAVSNLNPKESSGSPRPERGVRKSNEEDGQ